MRYRVPVANPCPSRRWLVPVGPPEHPGTLPTNTSRTPDDRRVPCRGFGTGFVVLTIAKMGAGQEEYYLGKVAGGLEDYYSGAGEVHGQWIGRGAERLRLSGDVDGAQLRALMEGLTPDRSARLAGRPGRTRTPGWDLTFSAPKSVSVLYGLGGVTVAEQVVAAHETAVTEALGWLEDHATVSRRRIGGQITTVAGEGLVVAAFRHRQPPRGPAAPHPRPGHQRGRTR